MKYLLVLIFLVLCSCVSIPQNFEGSHMPDRDNLALVSVLKKYDTYENLYLFKGHNWIFKFRMTGLKTEAEKLDGKFEDFVKAFMAQQKIRI